jgi:hypothetical protein
MYHFLYDEKHRIYQVTGTDFDNAKTAQTGVNEGNILCADCDNRVLGTLENYACKVLYGGKLHLSSAKYETPDGIKYTEIQGLDYNRFKLFLLSLLWRASISKDDFFSCVSLGPHEERIRSMIIGNNPDTKKVFPCVISSAHEGGDLVNGIIFQPRKNHFNHRVNYTFFIGGLFYFFRINDREEEGWFYDVTVNEEGGLKIIHLTKEHIRHIINPAIGRPLF